MNICNTINRHSYLMFVKQLFLASLLQSFTLLKTLAFLSLIKNRHFHVWLYLYFNKIVLGSMQK